MCGLAGILTRCGSGGTLSEDVEAMGRALTHRGPDDAGLWVDQAGGAALSFRRLAIQDLSPLGHQPMVSASGHFTMVFNGEVYNFRELRVELRTLGASFRGGSDTEVMLAAFDAWGIRSALQRFVGMFAIAVWDARDRTMILARDRLGIKPLYLFQNSNVMLFGSELKALVQHPSFDRTIDVNSVASYLRYLYIPGPSSIYARTRKVPPGHLITLRCDPFAAGPAEPYWDLEEVAASGQRSRFTGSEDEAVSALESKLKESVACRMVADVPLGAFLSGGIDSSTVVALMQAQSTRPVKTYSISFSDPDYDESDHARRVAQHLGTDHHQIDVTGQDILSLVPNMAETYDEPLADTAQLPLYLMCSHARRSVTVALSGDGGDEIFGGYNRYLHGERLSRWTERLPDFIHRGLADGAQRLAHPGRSVVLRRIAAAGGAALRERAPGERMAKVARLLHASGNAGRYRALVSVWDDVGRIVQAASASDDPLLRAMGRQHHTLLRRMMLADQLTYLTDDQLAKVDRASMASSLEVRVPLLDHRVVEFAWTLRRRDLVRGNVGKWILRRVLDRYVPRDLIDRPKMGFSVPIDRWLRGPLRQWADDLLQPDVLERDGLLNAAPVRQAWSALLAGRGDAALGIWAVVMLQAWRARWQQ